MNNTSMQQQNQFSLSKALSQEDILNDLDPMLEGGTFKVAFANECTFHIRQHDQDGQITGRRDFLNIRIMASPSLEDHTEIKIQISSQSNLYLIYECRMTDKKYQRLRKTQNLNFTFNNLLQMVIKLLSLCKRHPDQYTAVLSMSKTGPQKLSITENIQYKTIELLCLEFQAVSADMKKQSLAFRFSWLKSKNFKIQNMTNQMLAMVKVKSASLYQAITKKNIGIGGTATGNLSFVGNTQRTFLF